MTAVTPRIVGGTPAVEAVPADVAAIDGAAADAAAAGRAAAGPAGQPAASRAARRPSGSLGRVLVVSHPAVLAVNQHQYLALRELGWDVRLVVPARWHNDYRATGFAAEVLPGMEDAVLRRPVVLAGQPQRHAYLARPGALLRRLRPDVVLLEQEPFAMSAAQWGLAAARAGIPFGVQADENLDRPFPAPQQWIRSAVLARAAFVMARSPAAARLARTWGARGTVAVVPHPVVPWEPVEAPRDGTLTVGYAGRLVEAKGVRDLLAAADRMATPARVLVVGNGPLRDEVARHRKVELWDGHAHHDMPAAYARMDVLVLPSRRTPTWEEQFGRVLVEALSCGVPVIGSATGEIPWVVETTGGGWCTPEGDVDALAGLLDRVASDPDERAARAAAGAAAVAAQFSTPAVAASTSELLRQAVAPPPRSEMSEAKARRRLIFVAHDVGGIGGMEHAHGEILHRMAADWDVTVVSSRIDPRLRGSVRWHRVRVPRRPVPLKFAAFFVAGGVAVARMRSTRRPGGPVVVHTCGAIIPNRVDVATVNHCQVGLVATLGRLVHAGTPPVRRLNSGLQRLLSIAAERWSYRPGRVGTLHAISTGLGDEVARHFPGVDVVTIPYGVDTSVFRPAPDARQRLRDRYRVAEGTAVAIFVGGDWDRKGLGLVVQGLQVAQELGVPVVLWVIGRGDAERFAAEADRIGIGDRVQFLGRPDSVAEYYAAADMLVQASEYEGFSLVAHEAAASGLPIVATAVHGIVDLVGADQAGRIVGRDATELGRALAELAADPEQRQRMGAEARRRAQSLGWTDVVERVDELLTAPRVDSRSR